MVTAHRNDRMPNDTVLFDTLIQTDIQMIKQTFHQIMILKFYVVGLLWK